MNLSGSEDTPSLAPQSPIHIASRSKTERHYIAVYFRLLHPYWPFIHQGSFKGLDESPLPVQSMVVIGFWLSNEGGGQSRAMLARYCQNDLPAYVWVSIEEIKRFNFALYEVCTAYSCGVPNKIAVSKRGLRAQDLEFPLPRNTPLWNATSKAEWVSAATEDVYCHNFDSILENEWFSKSAHVLEALDTA
ncbi:hypothetical protein ASPVEDRAFT_333388 [Aspergillus versicolor CBS 583.65]|uniref:Uncharacterized protein n=1 Tax=Aspergillus versicolor CBS 583.65 TaxID=1036611 RepID=A0A1L9PYS7_ASPVE|nr:uncharacterized protein ASPVEDRAFT_333388 [Aspergillus versicolor CBS 583.65]OJJ06701.1 hypothetical protein ASPVEDRAFT_333388 [Aspergillus versicolor CBS 583.65]